MRFRPCIDVHNGKVKQIVGGSLREDKNTSAEAGLLENFVSEQDASYYANLYKKYGLNGGHVILLNPFGTREYEADKRQALLALESHPGGLQVGGGITEENAGDFLNKGASHVIITSFVFFNGMVSYERLRSLNKTIGKDRLVLDLSCRKKGDEYYIVTNRWQKYTDVKVQPETLNQLSKYCNEFLIHAVDVEGKASGVEEPLIDMLGDWGEIPITYAGGIGSYEDIEKVKRIGKGNLDFTVGSALDLFGGALTFEKVVGLYRGYS